jgi:hypothetical protein
MAQTDPYFFLPFFPRNYFLGITKREINKTQVNGEVKRRKKRKNGDDYGD